MLSVIAAAVVIFGWVCAAAMARHHIAQTIVHLAGIFLVIGFFASLNEEAQLRRLFADREPSASDRAWQAINRAEGLVDQINADQRRLNELCSQYPGTSGC
jgi:hypothetical protein